MGFISQMPESNNWQDMQEQADTIWKNMVVKSLKKAVVIINLNVGGKCWLSCCWKQWAALYKS